MSNCVDYEMLKGLIASVLLDMLQDGRLQPGLLTCSGERLAQDNRVVDCGGLADAVNDLIAADALDLPETPELPAPFTVSPADPSRVARSTDCAVPTTILGGRQAVLGAPVGYINVGGYVVPYFAMSDCAGATAGSATGGTTAADCIDCDPDGGEYTP